MKSTQEKYISWNTVLKAGISIAFILGLCSLFIYLESRFELLSPWKQAMESYQLTDLYHSFHKRQEVPSVDGRSVVLMDISSVRDRDEFAEVVDRIGDAEPYLVAFDVIFPAAVTSDHRSDSLLTAAVNGLPRVVLASELRPEDGISYSLKSSFFAEESGAVEGAVLLPDGIVRHWSPLVVSGQDTLQVFTKAIADMAGLHMPATTEPQLIDYSIVDEFSIDAAGDWDPSFIKDQIVLVGDLNDLRDTHQVPITLKTSVRRSGVSIHHQILLTCMNGSWFHVVPRWLTILLSLVILFAVTLLLIPVLDWADGEDQKIDRNPSVYTIKRYCISFFLRHISAIIQIALMVLAVLAGYLLFWVGGVYFDFKFLLTGYALLYLGFQFADALIEFTKVVIKHKDEETVTDNCSGAADDICQ